MNTPIYDFVKAYADADTARLHMPGHKGRGVLGVESLDITEVKGADALYEASGIIAESEKNAALLFGTAGSFYSTEGSSQCIRAMLYLALCCKKPGCSDRILAFRNVHRSFVYACALLDIEPVWLYPAAGTDSLCACPVTPEELGAALDRLTAPPAAVYITSPDYLGNMADIKTAAELCRGHGTRLIVDNAHGAYLHFSEPSMHPMDLGADMCCDSAHKTLPVLTGGAYLHISRENAQLCARAKQALALFGSTSPSYLTLMSLDLCNACLAGDFRERLRDTAVRIERLKAALSAKGWQILKTDALKLTINASLSGLRGTELAERLREEGIEPELSDPDCLVLMFTPDNEQSELERLEKTLGTAPAVPCEAKKLPKLCPERVCSIREALFSQTETAAPEAALGKICAAPTVSCPPAVPICAAGERIDAAAIGIFAHYGIKTVEIIKE